MEFPTKHLEEQLQVGTDVSDICKISKVNTELLWQKECRE